MKSDDASFDLASIKPDKGDVDGGTYVRLVGDKFIDKQPAVVKVYFGERQGEVVRIASPTEIIVQAPGGKPDEIVDVTLVIDGRGTITIKHAFTFVVKQTPGPSVNDLNKC